uniref:uncharacterized protein n=1 Tax=Myxine glutinosa TaxID=7769 RepID=UPI0035901097
MVCEHVAVSSLCHGEDDESTFSDESEECNVGQVMVGMWEVISKIGEGCIGFVYKAKNVNSAEEVQACDILLVCREASIMKALNHLNILKLIDIATKNPYRHRVILVLEYVEAGSLASQLRFLRKLPERDLWCPMKQMADAFEYMHSRNIVHRDIKPQNVLFSNKGIVKVVNFDFATPFIHGKKLYGNRASWGPCRRIAPEMTNAHGYEGPPVDVWALGVLFTNLFGGLRFKERSISIEIVHDKTDFNVGNSRPNSARGTLVSLLTATLQKHPFKRLTMTEIVNHTWFKENQPVEFLRNAEPKVSNGSVEEEYAGPQVKNVSVDEESAGPQVKNVSVDEEFAGSQVKNVSVDEEFAGSQVKNVSVDEEFAGSQVKNVSVDEEFAGSQVKNVSVDVEPQKGEF